jgi:hypothetical protein
MNNEKTLYYRYENDEYDNNFKLKEILSYGKSQNCFTNKEDAFEHFTKSQELADIKYNNIMNGINELIELYGEFRFDYFVKGDNQGMEEDGMYLEIEINGYCFNYEWY